MKVPLQQPNEKSNFTTIKISRETHLKLKLRAVKTGKTITELAEELILIKLNEKPKNN